MHRQPRTFLRKLSGLRLNGSKSNTATTVTGIQPMGSRQVCIHGRKISHLVLPDPSYCPRYVFPSKRFIFFSVLYLRMEAVPQKIQGKNQHQMTCFSRKSSMAYAYSSNPNVGRSLFLAISCTSRQPLPFVSLVVMTESTQSNGCVQIHRNLKKSVKIAVLDIEAQP